MSIRDLVKRSPQLSEDYVLTLGGAVYYFSDAEWMAVACCEAMEEGYKRTVMFDERHEGARNVAEKLISLTKKLPSSDGQVALLAAAYEFEALVVDDRNPLFHAHPVAVDDEAVLHSSKHQKTFSMEALEDYTQRAFDCQHALNHACYKFLEVAIDA